MAAYAWSLARMHGKRFSLRHPLYLLGMALYVGTVVFHIYGYILRWRAAGHAPLSNGYESLIFISVAIAIAGLYYELRGRRGSIGALSAMLTAFILGVAMLPTFDPAISPLVPVLSSFWLIVHVTVITASYGFLGLAAVMALTVLVLYLFKSPGRQTLRHAIADLHFLHWNVLIVGLAFLSVGTFLGGVWANESWGRYWGWDPKETWSLVTILVYAFVVHFRYVDRLNTPIAFAAGSFLGIASVGMTYFGVNYFLSGLHSYAQGAAPGVPGWVFVTAAIMVVLVAAALWVDRTRRWAGDAKANA
jgi:cytochrome c-type biogenesis protein CcsB